MGGSQVRDPPYRLFSEKCEIPLLGQGFDILLEIRIVDEVVQPLRNLSEVRTPLLRLCIPLRKE
jgi:hypothetical protein